MIIAYTMPLWTVVFGRLLVGERITLARLVALGLGLAGMAALLAPEVRALSAAPGGVLLMLAAAVSWASGRCSPRPALDDPDAVLTGCQVILGGVPIVVGAVLRLVASGAARPLSARLTSSALLGVAYATFVGVIFCHWAWFRIVAVLPAAVAAIGTLGIPIVGVFMSALVLGEAVGPAECGLGPGRRRAGHPAGRRRRPESRPGSPPSQRGGGNRDDSPSVHRPAFRPPARVWAAVIALLAARARAPPRPGSRSRPSCPSSPTSSSSIRWALRARPPGCGARQLTPPLPHGVPADPRPVRLDAEGRIASREPPTCSRTSQPGRPVRRELAPTGRETRYELRVLDSYVTGIRAN